MGNVWEKRSSWHRTRGWCGVLASLPGQEPTRQLVYSPSVCSQTQSQTFPSGFSFVARNASRHLSRSLRRVYQLGAKVKLTAAGWRWAAEMCPFNDDGSSITSLGLPVDAPAASLLSYPHHRRRHHQHRQPTLDGDKPTLPFASRQFVAFLAVGSPKKFIRFPVSPAPIEVPRFSSRAITSMTDCLFIKSRDSHAVSAGTHRWHPLNCPPTHLTTFPHHA